MHAPMPQVIVITGSINLLAPLVAGLFLLAFTLINLLAFLATLSRAPSDIHAFSFSPRWLSLLGFLLSFLSMAVALANSPPVCTCTCTCTCMPLDGSRPRQLPPGMHMYVSYAHVQHTRACTCAHVHMCPWRSASPPHPLLMDDRHRTLASPMPTRPPPPSSS